MDNPVLLDTGPLGRLAHPTPNLKIADWFKNLLSRNVQIVIPEIADYELRRNLILEGLAKSINRLDQLGKVLSFVPLTTKQMKKAAELWAFARKSGMPTAHDKALDGDVILASQALSIGGVVATENVSHLARYCEALHWKDIT